MRWNAAHEAFGYQVWFVDQAFVVYNVETFVREIEVGNANSDLTPLGTASGTGNSGVGQRR